MAKLHEACTEVLERLKDEATLESLAPNEFAFLWELRGVINEFTIAELFYQDDGLPREQQYAYQNDSRKEIPDLDARIAQLEYMSQQGYELFIEAENPLMNS